MKTIFLIPFLFPLLLACEENNGIILPLSPIHKEAVVEQTEPDTTDPTTDPGTPTDTPSDTTGQTTPVEPQTPVVIPEDAILVTNPLMEAYLAEVYYPEGDWSYSKIR